MTHIYHFKNGWRYAIHTVDPCFVFTKYFWTMFHKLAYPKQCNYVFSMLSIPSALRSPSKVMMFCVHLHSTKTFLYMARLWLGGF